MSSQSLQALADALKTASSGTVTLNAAFISTAGVTPPDGFDSALQAAFRLGEGQGLPLTFKSTDVGPVTGNSFKVTNAQLANSLLGATASQTTATLTFTLPSGGTGTPVLLVRIEVALSDWTFSKFFTYMTVWPFDQLAFDAPTFIFSTVAGAYTWNGNQISLSPGQNFAATVKVPTIFAPVFALAQGLGVVPPTLTIVGPIVISRADNESILYPDMDLVAVISEQQLKIFMLEARRPAIGLRVETVEGVDDNNQSLRLLVDGAETPVYYQTPSLYFGVKLDVEDLGGKKLSLGLEARLQRQGLTFGFTIGVEADSEVQLTPKTVIELMAGSSYFADIPSALQQFLASIALKGLAASGALSPKPDLTSIGVMMGSIGGSPLVVLGDPTNGRQFSIESIDVNWTLLSPLDPSEAENLITISTEFTLWPEVFRKSDGTPGGLFEISIDQDMNIDGAFDGQVSLKDLLGSITAGLILPPDGVEVTFSDVTLQINPSAKSYGFAFTLNASVDFITWEGKPLIQFQDMRFALAAMTPTGTGAKGATTYIASIDGLIGVGPIAVNTAVKYDGTRTPKIWTLTTSLAQPVSLTDILGQFFRAFDLPDFLPGALTIETFSVDATIPASGPSSGMAVVPAATGANGGSKYRVAGSLTWNYEGLPNFPIDTSADLGLQYDGSLPAGKQFSGSVIGTLKLSAIGVEVMIGYQFGPAATSGPLLQLPETTATGDSRLLWVQWEGIRATYDIDNQTITFSLKGWTVGSLLQALVRIIGDPYFTLDAPWDFLNKISLDGLSIVFNLKSGVQNRISANYSLSRPIDLGFASIQGLTFQLVDGKVTIAIDGTTSIPGLQDQPLFKPSGNGQDVQNMPGVPGRGNALFDLRLLALGQRVGIRDSGTFKSVQDVIKALEGIPSSSGGTNPVNPGSTQKGQPYYNESNNWLVAADFGLLRYAPGQYTFDCMIVFNDPDLYGLRLQCSGDKAKALAGLAIDILYKKITDDIGLYQIDFSFPNSIRNLNFGSVSIVLPSIGIQIYTNGDFFFDFGFPYNLDFSRSFTVMAVIYFVPVLGSAGFYFGKLSNATATNLPQTTKGTFDPVIVFGFGIQVGVGYYYQRGPLSAGFSITIFGIIQGTIAPWHPYDASGKPSGGALQGDYYFWLRGTFGIIGKLYGTVDFAVIKADVSLTIVVQAQITYESFRAIPLSISASVSIKVSIKINLGLFSIRISFSFAATISANLTIGSNSQAPWDDDAAIESRLRRLQRIAPVPVPHLLSAATPRFKPLLRVADEPKPTLTLVPAFQFTVLAPDINNTSPDSQQGAFVLLLAMDAPTADGAGNADGSSFESLCQALLPWVIDSLINANGEHADLAELDSTIVTKTELETIVDRLANNETPPITADQIIEFLQSGFEINVVAATESSDPKIRENLEAGSTIFPPFTGFSVTFPNPSGESGKTLTIALGDYVTITDAYRGTIATLFRQLAARVQSESQGAQAASADDDTPESLARFVFQDWFLLVARNLVQSASDALDDYLHELGESDSIASILRWAVERGNDVLTADDVAAPNLNHSLSGGLALSIEGLTYAVQQKDSLQTMAARYSDSSATPRWQTTPAELILANSTLSSLLSPGVTISVTVDGKPVQYTIQSGDSFKSVADALDISIEQLAADQGLYPMTDLLVAAVRMDIPAITYTTASDNSDTIQGIIGRFAMSLDAFLAPAQNLNATGLFDSKSLGTIRIANLESLYISDLWDGLNRDERVAQTAGMVARYQLHGMVLPNETGLGLPPNFVYPAGQPGYGIYQLTGQQFPTPPITEGMTYAVTLTRDETLSWIEFDGGTQTSLDVDLSSQARQVAIVLDYAKNPGYDPNPTLAPEPDVNVTPKRYAVRSATEWSTSDQARLAEITAPPAMAAAAAESSSASPQPQPVLWNLPETMLREAEQRQATLTNGGFNGSQSLPYLPVYLPEIAMTDPATRVTSYTPVSDYAFAVRIDIQIKQLAQDADQTPQTAFANSVVPPDPSNSGSAARPLAPFNYELVGPGPADAILLQRLLTAMDSLGDQMISDLFILYPDQSAAPEGLVSRGKDEFLAFITQTNLSTETNPPPALLAAVAGNDQPRGIANSPAEFVKLLWELSTVRSGGYYFYYELVGQGVGLPHSLFDASGNGVATLVIALDRSSEPAGGGRLTNYVNAFFTSQAIDRRRAAMILESQSNQAKTHSLSGHESMDDISNLYGADPGSLATLNSSVAFTPGAMIPIEGVFHQVTPADLAAGNVLEALATKYSKGAAQPLTAAEIADFNPGVDAALYSVFRIPPITYIVSPDPGGPGDAFAALRAYYALSFDALADLARGVDGLFPGATQLTTDSLTRDVQASLGVGNLGVQLTRANLGEPPDLPPNPTPGQKAEFARAYLFSLYTLLSAGLHGNAFFRDSGPGLSFGPRKSLDSGDIESIRHPESRRARLLAQDDEPFDYSQALGFGIFSTVNPAPTDEGLPAAGDNPYVGIGTLGQVNLRWLDIFGNQVITPFSAPPSDYTGPLNNLPVPIDYVDRLIGLDQWPNVRTYYTYGGTPDSPVLQLTLELNGQAYEEGAGPDDPRNQIGLTGGTIWRENTRNDLKTFTRVYFQLEQDYKNLKIPGLTGNAVSMSLTNTILANPTSTLSESDSGAIREFVRECITFLGAGPSGVAPITTLHIPVPIESVTPRNIIELNVGLTFERQSRLVDPALRAIDGQSVTSAIRPFTDDVKNAPPKKKDGSPADPAPQTLKVFADALESVFKTDSWQLRVGTGSATPDQPRGEKSFTVWAVRMGLKPGVGLTYEPGGQMSFFAPKPAAKELRTATVTLNQYATGKDYPDGDTVTVTFTGVDLNIWANSALAAIDAFLAPTFVAPAFILDNLFVPDPEKEGYVAKILKHKETLANAIARTIEPVLVTSATDQLTLAAGEEKLRQALLIRLSNAFLVTAVAVLPVKHASTNEPAEPGTTAPPRFFGQPLGQRPAAASLADTPTNGNFSLSTGKVALTPEGGSGDSRLAFLFSSRNDAAQAYVPLELTYALTHLEHDITSVPGIENYEQTSWIQFVNGPFNTVIGSEPIEFPVVLRALPMPPTISSQTATPSTGIDSGFAATPVNAAPGDLAEWDYALSYTYRQSAQDSLTATIEFNRRTTFGADLSADDALFAALAQFVTVYPAIAKDFDAYLRKINASSTSTDSDAVDAEKAVAAFESIVDGVAVAYDTWSRAQLLAGAGAPAQIQFSFEVVLSDDGGDARIDIKKISIVPPDAVLPDPVVLIDPDEYDYVAVAPPPDFLASYKYKRKAGSAAEDDFMPYEKALNTPQRSIAMKELNVFSLQNGWAEIQIVRNRFLVPTVETTPIFQFQTPMVAFAGPIVPLLEYQDYDLSQAAPDGSSMATYLGDFFQSLLNGAAGQTVVVKMSGGYSYLLMPGIEGSPRTSLPVALLPPTPTVPQSGEPPPFVDPVASRVDAWFKGMNPTLNTSSEFNFEMAVFAGPSSGGTLQMPLLTIRNAFVDAGKIKKNGG